MQTENLMIQSVLSNWRLTITRLSALFGSLSQTEFFEEIAPGRNRIVYVLGHLTAVHDSTLEVLGFGTRNHPQLDEVFIKNPDRVREALPSVADLVSFWEQVNQRLYEGMESLSPKQWVGRHRAVSDEDFDENPTRSCLTVALNRTNHASYHLGQLMLWRAHRG
jgi:hypothetical protein